MLRRCSCSLPLSSTTITTALFCRRFNHAINRPPATSMLFDDNENFDSASTIINPNHLQHQHQPHQYFSPPYNASSTSSINFNNNNNNNHSGNNMMFSSSSSPQSLTSSVYHHQHSHQHHHHHLNASTPVAAYTGHPFPPHATAILAEAAKTNGFTSPYWITSRMIRTKNIELKKNTPGPTTVYLEGDGKPKVYHAYFVDDINADDLSLFLRDVMLPIPENAWIAGTRASFMSISSSSQSNKAMRNQYYRNGGHNNTNNNNGNKSFKSRGNYYGSSSSSSSSAVVNNNKQNHLSPANAAAAMSVTMTPIVYVYKDRWRCPGNTNCAHRLCKWIFNRRGSPMDSSSFSPQAVTTKTTSDAGLSAVHQASSPPFPPVFIHSTYVEGLRLLPNAEPQLIEDSTLTLFFNADQTTLPPHSVVPIGFS